MSDIVTRLNAALEGRYRIERQLGEGGSATVYLAADLRHDRRVALKVLKRAVTESLDRAQFRREIEILAGLTHPNILPLHDSGSIDGLHFFVTPYVAGGSLRDRLRAQGALTTADAIQITAEIADALQTAHENGILHRDIKPENVLLSRGHALVADFGIAASVDAVSHGAAGGRIIATPRYMSPEQASGRPLDVTSDLYSLGCVLFEMLTGQPPFDARTTEALIAAHLTAVPPTLRDLGMHMSLDLQSVLDELLAKTPAERPRTATALLRRLRRATAGLGAAVASPAGQPNVGRLVARLCDRWRQVNAFDAFLRHEWATHRMRPQAYVVHGETGEAHNSLVDRLALTRVNRFAAEVDPAGRGHVSRVRVPWPRGLDLDVLMRDLPVALFRELSPSYMGDDLSAERLLDLPFVANASVVMIEHTLHSSSWNRATTELLRWYWLEFLGSLDVGKMRQQLLVFLKVEYSPARRGNPLAFWRSQRVRARIRRDLDAALADSGPVCSGLVMDELEPITIEDVKDWFVKNRIYESEETQDRLAESVLSGARSRGLAAVETALEEIHTTFVTEQATRRGQLS